MLEALVGVFERFFVDGFEVGEVALVVERFAELDSMKIKMRPGEGGDRGGGRSTSCAMSWTCLRSSHASSWPGGGVSAIRDTAPSQEASQKGQMRKLEEVCEKVGGRSR